MTRFLVHMPKTNQLYEYIKDWSTMNCDKAAREPEALNLNQTPTVGRHY